MFSALDLAEMGTKVYLVEKDQSIGGHMIKSTDIPNGAVLHVSSSKMVEVVSNRNRSPSSRSIGCRKRRGHQGNCQEKARIVYFNKCQARSLRRVYPSSQKTTTTMTWTAKAPYLQFLHATKKGSIHRFLYFRSECRQMQPDAAYQHPASVSSMAR